MEDLFICPICQNSDPDKIGYKDGVPYCRACLPFSGKSAPKVVHKPLNITLRLDYELTSEQQRIANDVLTNYKQKKNTLIYAVCGAGKTELVFKAIESALQEGAQIGFTVPRREVVIEIALRIKHAFPEAKVISVFGDHHDVLTANIIVLTTHQLFRYEDYFDLLIFDEIDAFPYVGDFVLEQMFLRSVKGMYVMLSATPSQKLIKKFSAEGCVLTLFTRFHNSKIPVPTMWRGYTIFNFVLLVKAMFHFVDRKKPVLVFVPTIKGAKRIYALLKLDFKNGNIVHSKVANHSKIIEDFKRGKYNYLVTTTVLERGVTIKGLQVIIYGADHAVYDSASLIQIAGRVGRKKEESDGEVIFIASKVTPAIREAISDIEAKNAYLQRMLQQEGCNTT